MQEGGCVRKLKLIYHIMLLIQGMSYEWYDRSYLKVMYDIIYDLTYMCVYDIYIEDIGKRQDSNLQEHVSMPTE